MTATAEKHLQGRYHPDDEIDAGVTADAHEAEQANLAAGFLPSPWECECGAAHARGPIEGGAVHRCLNCGYVGEGGRYMEAAEFQEYRANQGDDGR
jgi:hypothetical protein